MVEYWWQGGRVQWVVHINECEGIMLGDNVHSKDRKVGEEIQSELGSPASVPFGHIDSDIRALVWGRGEDNSPIQVQGEAYDRIPGLNVQANVTPPWFLCENNVSSVRMGRGDVEEYLSNFIGLHNVLGKDGKHSGKGGLEEGRAAYSMMLLSSSLGEKQVKLFEE